MKQKTRREEKMDRRRADLLLDPRRLRNDDPNHRRGGYGRDRSPRSRSRIYLISPRGTTVPRQRVRPTLILLLLLLPISFSASLRPQPSCPQFPRLPFPFALLQRPYVLTSATPVLPPPPTRCTNTIAPTYPRRPGCTYCSIRTRVRACWYTDAN